MSETGTAMGEAKAPDAPAAEQPKTDGATLYTKPEEKPEAEKPKEEKPEEAKAPEGEKKEEKPEAKPEGEAKPLEIKAPEGVTLDQKSVDGFRTLASSLNGGKGISQEDAQKLADFSFTMQKQMGDQFTTASRNAWNETISGWNKELEADPDLGGEKRATAMTTIGRAIDQFGGPEGGKALREAFDLTGAGSHPAVVKFVYAMAKQLTEGGSLVTGQPRGAGPKTPGDALYGERTN